MIIYIKGDLFETPDLVIAHGCNTQGVMGSGVAKEVKARYPKAFRDYNGACYAHTEYNRNDTRGLLGQVIWSMQMKDGQLDKAIANLITQDTYGRDTSNRYVSYDAIDQCLVELDNHWVHGVDWNLPKKISMPKIGAGLGNGNWYVIEEIIKHRLDSFDEVNIYYL